MIYHSYKDTLNNYQDTRNIFKRLPALHIIPENSLTAALLSHHRLTAIGSSIKWYVPQSKLRTISRSTHRGTEFTSSAKPIYLTFASVEALP